MTVTAAAAADNLVHNLSSKSLTPAQLEVIRGCANFNIANASVIDFVASLKVALASDTK